MKTLNVDSASTRGQAVPTPETDYSKSADERYGPVNIVSDSPETDALFVKITQALVTAKTVEELLAFARRLEAANTELVKALEESYTQLNRCMNRGLDGDIATDVSIAASNARAALKAGKV